jgi:hypothetical protein
VKDSGSSSSAVSRPCALLVCPVTCQDALIMPPCWHLTSYSAGMEKWCREEEQQAG